MLKLHHSAHQVTAGSKDLIAELFTSKLGFREVFRNEQAVLLRQGKTNVDIQFIAKSPGPGVTQEVKIMSHIGFTTNAPREDLEELQQWFRERGHHSEIGRYYDDTDMDLWFDVPGVFLDFVIEAVHTQFLADLKYPAHDE
jgi:hypothetical protein